MAEVPAARRPSTSKYSQIRFMCVFFVFFSCESICASSSEIFWLRFYLQLPLIIKSGQEINQRGLWPRVVAPAIRRMKNAPPAESAARRRRANAKKKSLLLQSKQKRHNKRGSSSSYCKLHQTPSQLDFTPHPPCVPPESHREASGFSRNLML